VLDAPWAQSSMQSKRSLSLASFKLPPLKEFGGVSYLDPRLCRSRGAGLSPTGQEEISRLLGAFHIWACWASLSCPHGFLIDQAGLF